jgi:uncharacterized DUF497 family protein
MGENGGLHDRRFQFEWDDVKAAANVRKHGVSFDHARTVFYDALLLTIADLQHGEMKSDGSRSAVPRMIRSYV